MVQFVQNSELGVVGLHVSTFDDSYFYLNQAEFCTNEYN